MSGNPAPFSSITELLERSLSIRLAYGDPVQHGDTILIPVAQVAYGFGAGGGIGHARVRPSRLDDDAELSPDDLRPEAQGGGGGGGVRMTPVGALVLTPEGERFVHVHPLAPCLIGGAIGGAAGWLLGRLSSHSPSSPHALDRHSEAPQRLA